MTKEVEIQSPCIGVCSMNETTGFCHGCYRTIEEIQQWWDLDHQQKQEVVLKVSEREAQQFS
ncbi:MAG TPA: DUF1289 domain-containing protein [Methylotenera sp.]|nr:DUF1289 domain-containing protein [Methylotenera sp.]HPV44973.1 DUF1289 domain-containing protein [Methylotenera sp.]